MAEQSLSDKMEPSAYHDRIVALGRLIVSEFEDERGETTLPRWMAYRIAELIESAKDANDAKRERLESECQRLILTLWKVRHHWPRKGSWRSVLKLLDVLSREATIYSHRDTAPEGSFLHLRDQLDSLASQEADLCLSAEIATYDLSTEADLLANHRDQLSSDEIDFLTFLLKKQEELRSPIRARGLSDQPVLMDLTEQELVVKVKQILTELSARRIESIKVLGKAAKGGSPKPKQRKSRQE